MHTSFPIMKKNARCALRGRWGQACAIVLLVVAISILFALAESALTLFFDIPAFLDLANTPGFYLDDLPSTTLPSLLLSGGLWLLSALVLVPLNLGVVQWYCGVTCGRQEDISLIFTFFDSPRQMLRALWAGLQLTVRSFLWGCILFTPTVLLFTMSTVLGGSSASSTDRVMSTLGWVMGLLFALLAALLLWISLQRYYLVPYLLCGDRSMKVSTAFRQSARTTYGYKTDLVLFKLSFTGWYLASLLVLPALYTFPYLYTSQAIMARYLLEKAGATQFFKDCTAPAQ